MAKQSYKYELGQLVYLVHDPDQYLRMITTIHLNLTGVNYQVSCGAEVLDVYEEEIALDKKVF